METKGIAGRAFRAEPANNTPQQKPQIKKELSKEELQGNALGVVAADVARSINNTAQVSAAKDSEQKKIEGQGERLDIAI